MSNPNFVSDLVAMAKAFEELPEVKAELEATRHDFSVAQDQIQQLQLRIIDLKNAKDEAYANIRKVEVQRDHAEQMFLETDERLNAFRRLVQAFDTDVKSLVKAEEPEPTSAPTAPAEVLPSVDPVSVSSDPTTASPTPATSASPTEDASSTGERAVDPTTATTQASPDTATTTDAFSVENTSTNAPEVASPSDPTLAMESSSENVSSDSVTENDAPLMNSTIEPRPESSTGSNQPEGVSVPSDPTASFTAGDGLSHATATPATDASHEADATTQVSPTLATEVDDVGYHNEPKIIGVGSEAWAAWDDWCARMTKRYPSHLGGWPARTA